jgi:hypothetical protein
LKEVDRVLEKLVRSYERDPARVLDYCRQVCKARLRGRGVGNEPDALSAARHAGARQLLLLGNPV